MTVIDASARTFSNSWHRVATVKVALRPNVRAHRQDFRGTAWYILRDPLNNQFFQISREAYAFLCRLSPARTVDEAWREMLEHDPEAALSQEEVVQLLGQLNMSNLLYFDAPAVAASLFDRYRLRRERETQSRLTSLLLSIRIPLFDPDKWLNRAAPLIRLLFSPLGLAVWLLWLLLAAKVAMDHRDTLFEQAPDLLAPGNLVLLYAGFLLTKVVHEFSHAAACKRFGGEVHDMGVMLVVFTPMPYVDASASWGFRRRWQRMLVGAAGMLAEFALGSLAVLVWAWSAPGSIHAIAYNVMFVATISTVLFNINPLLRFDGYYILTDLLDVPNLYQRAREQLRAQAEWWLFGLEPPRSMHAPLEGRLLALYGLFSLLYWGVVISGIILFMADQYLDLGLLLALFLLVSSIVIPLGKLLHFLVFSPRLEWHRGRAILVVLVLGGVLYGVLGVLPMPDRIRAPGVVEALPFRELNSPVSGFLVELLVRPGTAVVANQPLVHLDMPDLDLEIRSAELQKEQIVAQIRQAENSMVADLAPLREQLQAVESSLADLQRKRASLEVIAPIAGLWSAPDLDGSIGKWIPRGTSLGTIVDPTAYRFVAVLPQVATHLFGRVLGVAEVRLTGQEDHVLTTEDVRVVPFQHGTLPSPALGWAGGGDIAVEPNNPTVASEPFFLLHARFEDTVAHPVRLLHGRSGTLRMDLGYLPLLWQWERGLRQFLQQKYRL
ncbi:MAG: hypothetical protein HQL87_05295 [Magnetococcales bacterium]|nr:hypothetical protein [Magnetococcales bacterium]